MDCQADAARGRQHPDARRTRVPVAIGLDEPATSSSGRREFYAYVMGTGGKIGGDSGVGNLYYFSLGFGGKYQF
jgi:hypothetical protein